MKKGTMVKIIETGETYQTISQCARALGTYPQMIIRALQKNTTVPGGYHVRVLGKRAMADMPKRMYIRLRKGTDEPMAIADTEQELADMLGISASAVSKGILRHSPLYDTVIID